MQVDPISPMLKLPEPKRLKPPYHNPHSNLAFKFNLRSYNMEMMMNRNTHMRLPAPPTRPGLREHLVDVPRERCFQLSWGS